MLIPVILSGGSGTRLWPLSRKSYPKQLLALTSQNSLFQEAVKRTHSIDDVGAPLVICNEKHYFIIREQLMSIGIKEMNFVLEPMGRSTAPAISIAAHLIKEIYGDATMLVMPADLIIKNNNVFYDAVSAGLNQVEQGKLLTFGIVPNEPKTGYGYIKQGSELDNNVYQVEKFVEKPNLETAQQYLGEGDYFWNSGMFMFTASAFLSELSSCAEDVSKATETAFTSAIKSDQYLRLKDKSFAQCPDVPVDIAVMERTDKAIMVPMDAGWMDVGDWASLADSMSSESSKNIISGDVIDEGSEGCYLNSESRLLATVGLRNTIVVETHDAVLVADKSKAQKVKNIVERLREQGHASADSHPKVMTGWGSYFTAFVDDGVVFKKLVITAGSEYVFENNECEEFLLVVKGFAEGEQIFVPGSMVSSKTCNAIKNTGKGDLIAWAMQLH